MSSWRSRSRWMVSTRRCNLAGGAKNLKVGVGLMCRHCAARELCQRLRAGERADYHLRAYRIHDAVGFFTSDPKPEGSATSSTRSTLPQLPFSGSGAYRRLLHPQHRRVLLDEGCLAGGSQGLGATTAATRWKNFNVYSVEYLRRRGEAVPRWPLHAGLPQPVCQLRPWHQGLVTISGAGTVLSAASIAARPAAANLAWDYGQGAPNLPAGVAAPGRCHPPEPAQ